MFGLFAPKCPVGPRERVWVERGSAELIDRLGLDWVRRTPVITGDQLGDLLRQEPIAAAEIAGRLQDQFPFAVAGIEWVEDPDISGQQLIHYLPGDQPAGIVPHQPGQSAEQRVSHVVRILCEHALQTAPELRERQDVVPLALDLLGVLAAIGLFPANTSTFSAATAGAIGTWRLAQAQQMMPSRLFGYAFAVRSWLCEDPSEWSTLLRLDAREPLQRGLKFLGKQPPVIWDRSRDALRSFRSPPPTDEVARDLHHRDAARQINALYDVIAFGIQDETIDDEIGHLVHDPAGDVREEAIRTIVLLNRNAPAHAEALTMLADDAQPRIRALAARAIGDVQHPPHDSVETLRNLTSDPEPVVSTAAAESLLAFPEGRSEDRSRVFRVLRQQLARCNYESVDRFMQRLSSTVPDAEQLIAQEFAGSEEESWRQLLLESLAAAK